MESGCPGIHRKQERAQWLVEMPRYLQYYRHNGWSKSVQAPEKEISKPLQLGNYTHNLREGCIHTEGLRDPKELGEGLSLYKASRGCIFKC